MAAMQADRQPFFYPKSFKKKHNNGHLKEHFKNCSFGKYCL
jgi:hypothetical protein